MDVVVTNDNVRVCERILFGRGLMSLYHTDLKARFSNGKEAIGKIQLKTVVMA